MEVKISSISPSFSSSSPREDWPSTTHLATTDPQFWKLAADAVEGANVPKQLDALTKIQPIVMEASTKTLENVPSQIAALKTHLSDMRAQNSDHPKIQTLEAALSKMEALEKALRQEAGDYPRWSADLQSARLGTKEEFSKVKQSFVEHTERLTSRIEALSSTAKEAWAGATAGAGAMGISYGGATGNEIFKTMNSTYIVPMMQAFIEKFSAETNPLPYDEQLHCAVQFLDQFLDRAGEGRNTIAHLSGSTNVQDFGRRRAAHDAPMRDTCDASTFYKPWKSHITNKTSTLVFQHPAVTQWRALGGATKPLSDFVNETGTLQHGVRAVQLIANGLSVELSVDNSTQPPTCRGTLFGSPHDPSAAHYEFQWAEHSDGHLVLSNLICEHATLANNNVPLDAAKDFLAIARWNKGDSVDALRDSIASFFFTISNSSTYFRGQAAIAEEILKAIQLDKGVQIKLADSILKPHPTIDQQALSMFDRGQFIVSMREQILIEEPQ